jgi:hypothetical protein
MAQSRTLKATSGIPKSAFHPLEQGNPQHGLRAAES